MESSSSPPKTSPIVDPPTSAIQELIKAKELGAQLRIELQKSPDYRSRPEMAQTLAEKLERSIACALLILNSGEAGENRRNPSNTQLCSSCSDDGSSKNSREIKQIPVVKDRRGCYKRRRTSDTWTRVSATPVDDGHSWRKYGQKEILGCKYPRSYFRCTHKHDQGCQATKQVQQMEEQSSKYQITYMGHHTCKDLLKAPQFILDTTIKSKETVLLSFESNSIRHQSPSFFSSFNSIKQEIKEENMPSDITQMSSPSSGYPVPSDLTTFESCEPLMEISDAGEVMSGMCANSHTLDMEMFLNPAKMDDWLRFDDAEEFFKSSL